MNQNRTFFDITLASMAVPPLNRSRSFAFLGTSIGLMMLPDNGLSAPG